MLKRQNIGLLFIAPMMISVFVFVLYPIVNSFQSSFFRTNLIDVSFIGMKNYIYILNSSSFYESLWNTFIMMFYQTMISVPFAFIIASLINGITLGRGIFRTAYFLPNITSVVVTIFVFRYLFHSTEAGMVNFLLKFVGIESIAWFSPGPIIHFTVAILGSWIVFGYFVLLFLAGMQSIPRDLYEVASIDGAGFFNRWLFITIPLSRGTISFVLIMSFIWGMQRLTDVFVLRKNGAIIDPLQTSLLYIYDLGFKNGDFGAASAASILFFIVILLSTFLIVHYLKIIQKQ